LQKEVKVRTQLPANPELGEQEELWELQGWPSFHPGDHNRHCRLLGLKGPQSYTSPLSFTLENGTRRVQGAFTWIQHRCLKYIFKWLFSPKNPQDEILELEKIILSVVLITKFLPQPQPLRKVSCRANYFTWFFISSHCSVPAVVF
jgi:hypothetical protein